MIITDTKYVADIPQLSARGMFTGTATRVLGDPSVQPYKYGAKELDRQNGLDWYDSQARMYDPLLGRTPTMDPKAEDYAPISPYAWCAGNPILFVDPTGCYTLKNISPFSHYSVIAVFPDDFNASNGDPRAINDAYQPLNERNAPIILVSNIADYSDAMSAINRMGATTSSYVITSHGSPGSFNIGSEKVSWGTNVSGLKHGLAEKNVVINACSTGNGTNGSGGDLFVETLAAETNSTVVASTTDLKSMYTFDGSEIPASNGQPNNFVMSKQGSDVQTVTEVRVHSLLGVSWNAPNNEKKYDLFLPYRQFFMEDMFPAK